jgi:hypothetical protein
MVAPRCRPPRALAAAVAAAALLALAAAQTSPTSSRTATPTQTSSRSPSAAATGTRTPTATSTGTRTGTQSATATRTGTQSATGTATSTKTPSSSGTLSTGATPSATPTPSGTVTSGVTEKLSLSSGNELYQYVWAGTGTVSGASGDGGPPAEATVISPSALAVDPLTGDLCWSQACTNYTVRCASDSRVYRLLGNGSNFGVIDSAADPLATSIGPVYALGFGPNGGEFAQPLALFHQLGFMRN